MANKYLAWHWQVVQVVKSSSQLSTEATVNSSSGLATYMKSLVVSPKKEVCYYEFCQLELNILQVYGMTCRPSDFPF